MKIILNQNQIIELIHNLMNTYEICTHKSRLDFINGNCFYLVKILISLLPEAFVYYADNHYFILYDDNFYDYRGIITKNKTHLKIYNDNPTPLNSITYIPDIIIEEDYANFLTFTTKEKQKEFEYYGPILIKTGNQILENLKEKSRKRTILE